MKISYEIQNTRPSGNIGAAAVRFLVQVGAKALPIIFRSLSPRSGHRHGRQVASAALRCSRHTPCCIATMRRSPAINRAIGLSHWRPSGVYIGRFVEELGNLPSCRGSGGGRRNRAEEAAAAAEEEAKKGHTP